MEPTKNKVLDGEKKVAAVLSAYGHTVEMMPPTWRHFDLLMDGKIKIEVKASLPSLSHTKNKNRLVWFFNIHRHNKLDESNFDFYVFRFEGIPGSRKAIHALFKPPLNRRTVAYTERQLLEGAISDGVKAFRELNLRRRIKNEKSETN